MELAGLRNHPRVGRVDAFDVGVDLADLRSERRGECDGGRVRTAAAEGRDVLIGGHSLKAGDEHDPVLPQPGPDPLRADIDDPRLGVRRVGDDPRL